MRIVGGEWRGRVLKAPQSMLIRPSSERLREALFNILVHRYEDVVEGAIVLDLFAGTGALGLEALSRGAEAALFVDDGLEATRLIAENMAMLKCGTRARLFKRDATNLTPNHDAPATLVFCDPPYGKGLGEKALLRAGTQGYLAPDALVVFEERASSTIAALPNFTEIDQRLMGESQMRFYRYKKAHEGD